MFSEWPCLPHMEDILQVISSFLRFLHIFLFVLKDLCILQQRIWQKPVLHAQVELNCTEDHKKGVEDCFVALDDSCTQFKELRVYVIFSRSIILPIPSLICCNQ